MDDYLCWASLLEFSLDCCLIVVECIAFLNYARSELSCKLDEFDKEVSLEILSMLGLQERFYLYISNCERKSNPPFAGSRVGIPVLDRLGFWILFFLFNGKNSRFICFSRKKLAVNNFLIKNASVGRFLNTESTLRTNGTTFIVISPKFITFLITDEQQGNEKVD